jgi:hypothetical protein
MKLEWAQRLVTVQRRSRRNTSWFDTVLDYWMFLGFILSRRNVFSLPLFWRRDVYFHVSWACTFCRVWVFCERSEDLDLFLQSWLNLLRFLLKCFGRNYFLLVNNILSWTNLKVIKLRFNGQNFIFDFSICHRWLGLASTLISGTFQRLLILWNFWKEFFKDLLLLPCLISYRHDSLWHFNIDLLILSLIVYTTVRWLPRVEANSYLFHCQVHFWFITFDNFRVFLVITILTGSTQLSWRLLRWMRWSVLSV